ncbi:MAG: hypothetical protein GYA33_07830 [Thermogutta sp.]|nr:hypothetical protein [Thermogutta sp.]
MKYVPLPAIRPKPGGGLQPGAAPRPAGRATRRRPPLAFGRASAAPFLCLFLRVTPLCLFLCVTPVFGTAWATENGLILLAPSAEDLPPSLPAVPPSIPAGIAPAPSPDAGSTAIGPSISAAPAPAAGQGGWVRAGTGRSQGYPGGSSVPGNPPSTPGATVAVPNASQTAQPPAMFYGTARPLINPAAASPSPQGGLSPGGSSPYALFPNGGAPPNGGAQPGVGPYAAGQPGPYAIPRQEPKKGWFGLPKLDLSKLGLGKVFRRKPQNPTYGPVAAPTAIQPNPSAWREAATAGASAGYPPQTTGEVIRQPDWNRPDPPRFSGTATNVPPQVYGGVTSVPGASTGVEARAAAPQWNPQNPYAAPYAVPPRSDPAWATTPQDLPLTALPPQGGQAEPSMPLNSAGESSQVARIASPTPYAGPSGTLFGGTGTPPATAPTPDGGVFGKPTFWDRVKVWWKDVTTPRRDNPRAALLPPGQAWHNLQSRLEPRPQTPGQDPFTAQRGEPYAVDAAEPGAASAMQRRNYSPALLPPPQPQLPGSVSRW